jgi:hypothetical protein
LAAAAFVLHRKERGVKVQEKKIFQSNIRYTKTLKDIIEKQEGTSFSEKFENLILTCYRKKPKMEKEIELCKEDIVHLRQRIGKYRKIERRLSEIFSDINKIARAVKQILAEEK